MGELYGTTTFKTTMVLTRFAEQPCDAQKVNLFSGVTVSAELVSGSLGLALLTRQVFHRKPIGWHQRLDITMQFAPFTVRPRNDTVQLFSETVGPGHVDPGTHSWRIARHNRINAKSSCVKRSGHEALTHTHTDTHTHTHTLT